MIILDLISNNTEFIIGSFALFLATKAYVSSEKLKYENIKSLLLSFKKELEFQSAWINGNYPESFSDKEWFSPNKIVHVLSFETGKEILKRGVINKNFIDDNFYEILSRFIERIDAFNNTIIFQQNLISSNTSISQKLINFLKENKNNDFCDLKLKFYSNNIESDEILLARALYQGNHVIHIQLIGDGTQNIHLQFMYKKLNEYIDEFVKDYEKRIPFWFRKISSFKIC